MTLTLELHSVYTLLLLLEPPSSPNRFGLRFHGGERTEFERCWNRAELKAFQKLSSAVNAVYALSQAFLLEEVPKAV